MSPLGRCLWLSLYASPQARLLCPGLWSGGLAVMAEAASLGFGDAQTALRELRERGIVYHDETRKLTLFAQLPDRGQRPANGRCILMYYNRWLEQPRCDLTEAYVWLLHWLCQPFTGDHQKAWDRTFGKDTGVLAATEAITGIVRLSTNGISRLVTPSTKVHEEPSCGLPVDESNQTTMFPQEPDTVSDTVSDTHMCTVDLSSGSGKGGAGGRSRGPKNGKGKRPWGVKDLLVTMKATCPERVATEPWDVRMAKPLWAVVDACIAAEVSLDDVRLAGEWLAAGGLGYRDDLGIPWLAKTGELLNAVAKARVWSQGGRAAIENRKKGAKAGSVTAADLAARAAALEAAGD